jgi:prenyltransferase beta subunit
MRVWLTGVLFLVCWPAQLPAQGPTAAEKKATVAWLDSLQKDNGGFAADKDATTPATLPATTSALRALRYFGGQPRNKEACVQFVRSCYVKVETGFAPMPGGKADVHTTAVGLLAVKELNITDAELLDRPVIFLCLSAKNFEQWRISAAAYEAVGSKCDLSADWVAGILRTRKPDGTYGKDGSVARDTASAVVTLLRLGTKVDDPENVVKALRAGQHADGGWGKAADNSDLETTYRVLRAFVMLEAAPADSKACEAFVARCRNEDGSYGPRPGQPGTAGATYHAGIVLHWLAEARK